SRCSGPGLAHHDAHGLHRELLTSALKSATLATTRGPKVFRIGFMRLRSLRIDQLEARVTEVFGGKHRIIIGGVFPVLTKREPRSNMAGFCRWSRPLTSCGVVWAALTAGTALSQPEPPSQCSVSFGGSLPGTATKQGDEVPECLLGVGQAIREAQT